MNIALFKCPHSQEQDRLQRIIDAQERELEHRANIISDQADEIVRLKNGVGATFEQWWTGRPRGARG